jgi:hypothetical protein
VIKTCFEQCGQELDFLGGRDEMRYALPRISRAFDVNMTAFNHLPCLIICHRQWLPALGGGVVVQLGFLGCIGKLCLEHQVF